MRFLVFDTGSLISLTLCGILDILKKIKEINKETEFVLTPQIINESIEKSLNSKKYSFEAIRINHLLEKNIIKKSSEFLKDNEIFEETKRVLSIANNLISVKNEKVNLIHEGEASCIAFSKLVKEPCLIVTDERNVRLISESPEKLKEIMERKLHTQVFIDSKNLSYFKDLKYIRSSELVFYAFKKGLFDFEKKKEVLEAILYDLKFHGTAITSKEIEEMVRSV